MVQKIRRKKSVICILGKILITIAIASLIYKSLITLKLKIFEKKNNDSIVTVPPETELDIAGALSSGKLYSSNAVLIRLKNNTVLMEKTAKIEFILLR